MEWLHERDTGRSLFPSRILPESNCMVPCWSISSLKRLKKQLKENHVGAFLCWEIAFTKMGKFNIRRIFTSLKNEPCPCVFFNQIKMVKDSMKAILDLEYFCIILFNGAWKSCCYSILHHFTPFISHILF